MATAEFDQKAQAAIRHVLNGNPPDGVIPEDCGPWAEAVQDLYDAYAQGGTAAVKRVFEARSHLELGLTKLVAGDKPETPRYTLHSSAEALAPQPPIEWVISDLFSAGSVALLVGDPGTAKTYSLLDAAVCVALGEPWLDHQTLQGSVLVVDEESGPRRLARRLGDCLRGHTGTADTPVYYTTLERFNLREPDDVQALQDAIEETRAHFVLIDALVDVMPGADENQVGDVHPVFMTLRGIAEKAGVAFVVIHHNNKSGGYRGSSAMKGAVDVLLAVTKKGDLIKFDLDKSRDTEHFAFSARGHWEDERFWLKSEEAQQARATLGRANRYVLSYLAEHGPSTTTEIISHADICSSNSARSAIYALADAGLVRRTDTGGSGKLATYDLADLGREAASAIR